MAELAKANLIDTSLLTCTGKTIAENLEGVVNRDPELIRPIDNPYSKTGGIAVLKGNLAPDGCVVKQSAVAPEMMTHTGPRPGVQLRGGCHRRHLRREDRGR